MPQRPKAKRRNVSRMSTSAIPSQLSQALEKEPEEPDPGPWEYDRDLRAILHDGKSCKPCLAWREHFVDSIKDKDELLSITAARCALDSASDVQHKIDEIQRRRKEASETQAKLRRKLNVVQGDLSNVLRGEDMGMYATKYLNSESD